MIWPTEPEWRLSPRPGSRGNPPQGPFPSIGAHDYLESMARQTQADRDRSASWKRKMGVEFSGLERPRDFWYAIAFIVGFIAISAVVAFVVFG